MDRSSGNPFPHQFDGQQYLPPYDEWGRSQHQGSDAMESRDTVSDIYPNGWPLSYTPPQRHSNTQWGRGTTPGSSNMALTSGETYHSISALSYSADPMTTGASPPSTTVSSRPAPFYVGALPQRRPSNRDEFDGPAQFLPRPVDADKEPKEEDLPSLPTHLFADEQDEILQLVTNRLSLCAFDFVSRYSFPIPMDPDKQPVTVPGDREWSEWVFLLKRLATKRRIPSRVLFNGQIRQLVPTLENSLETRTTSAQQPRLLKDDRNVLQLISSGIQVGKMLKDAGAMMYLDNLYARTECLVASRLL